MFSRCSLCLGLCVQYFICICFSIHCTCPQIMLFVLVSSITPDEYKFCNSLCSSLHCAAAAALWGGNTRTHTLLEDGNEVSMKGWVMAWQRLDYKALSEGPYLKTKSKLLWNMQSSLSRRFIIAVYSNWKRTLYLFLELSLRLWVL